MHHCIISVPRCQPLQEFDRDGNKVSSETESKGQENSGGSVIGWIIGGIAVLAAVVGGVWFFVIYSKKK